jgi:hypothetical protein
MHNNTKHVRDELHVCDVINLFSKSRNVLDRYTDFLKAHVADLL